MSEIYLSPIFTSQTSLSFINTPTAKVYKPGDIIIQVGDHAQHLHYLIKGKVKYVIMTSNGAETILHTSIGPALFGEVPFFSGLPSFGTFVACEKSHIQLIDRKDITKEQLEVLCAQMARKIRVANLQYESTFNSAEARLARLFYTLSISVGKDIVENNQRELADMAGLHYMTVNKLLKKLEEMKIVTRSRKFIKIIDTKAMMTLAGLHPHLI